MNTARRILIILLVLIIQCGFAFTGNAEDDAKYTFDSSIDTELLRTLIDYSGEQADEIRELINSEIYMSMFTHFDAVEFIEGVRAIDFDSLKSATVFYWPADTVDWSYVIKSNVEASDDAEQNQLIDELSSFIDDHHVKLMNTLFRVMLMEQLTWTDFADYISVDDVIEQAGSIGLAAVIREYADTNYQILTMITRCGETTCLTHTEVIYDGTAAMLPYELRRLFDPERSYGVVVDF